MTLTPTEYYNNQHLHLEEILEQISCLGKTELYRYRSTRSIKGTRFFLMTAFHGLDGWKFKWMLKNKTNNDYNMISFSDVLSSSAVRNKYKRELLYYINYFS